MADVHSKETRSFNMSKIKGKDTKPEMLVRKYLFSHGFRYRVHDRRLPGNPDIVLPKYRTAIFIHGCFWHGHEGCRYFIIPKTRTEWWVSKLSRNTANDEKALTALHALGWKAIVIWECDLKKATLDHTLKALLGDLRSTLVKQK
ncbi:DNA mismatch endonuclease Vsr [Chitinophaga horti]|uniref:Very short patch repair endonuclease n=1 Tax=Chitinophaga horti TaxID=2920382 RepID=A0ABY6J5J4_9BACT|nr:DNA mismatch endonuclease Vsr [Chitinophaga horti]UYQ94954.1 DNA mismatch endonuclease Vsr [Chitinophaga horti]